MMDGLRTSCGTPTFSAVFLGAHWKWYVFMMTPTLLNTLVSLCMIFEVTYFEANYGRSYAVKGRFHCSYNAMLGAHTTISLQSIL